MTPHHALAVIAVLLGARLFAAAAAGPSLRWLAILLAIGWIIAAVAVLRPRLRPLTYTLIAVLGAAELVAAAGTHPVALQVVAWVTIILVVTQERPDEQRLPIRVLVTTVYAFAALAKLNPAWLSGDAVRTLVATRPQLHGAEALVDGRLAVLVAVMVIAVELWLAIGLWFAATRRATAAIGVVTHLSLVAAAGLAVTGTLGLLALNLGLVALYPAFFPAGGIEVEPATPGSRGVPAEPVRSRPAS